MRKFCSVKAKGFWFKNWYFPLSACCSQLSVSPSGWLVTYEAQVNQSNFTNSKRQQGFIGQLKNNSTGKYFSDLFSNQRVQLQDYRHSAGQSNFLLQLPVLFLLLLLLLLLIVSQSSKLMIKLSTIDRVATFHS